MTNTQKQQFNRMRNALRRIAYDYQTAEELRKNEGQYGLDFDEEIEMSYDNMQNDAKNAVKNIRAV